MLNVAVYAAATATGQISVTLINREHGNNGRRANVIVNPGTMMKKVTGAASHCVAGDGLRIVTAMIIARLIGMKFWQEFWFEYGAGFVFGWLIFQYKSMTKMTQSVIRRLAMAFRAEFFPMLAVMPGMGIVPVWPLAATTTYWALLISAEANRSSCRPSTWFLARKRRWAARWLRCRRFRFRLIRSSRSLENTEWTFCSLKNWRARRDSNAGPSA